MTSLRDIEAGMCGPMRLLPGECLSCKNLYRVSDTSLYGCSVAGSCPIQRAADVAADERQRRRTAELDARLARMDVAAAKWEQYREERQYDQSVTAQQDDEKEVKE